MNKKWFIAAGLCIIIGVAGMVAYGAPWNQQAMREITAIDKKWTFTRGQLQDLKVNSSDDVSIVFTPGSGEQGTIRMSGEVQTKVADQIHNARIENGKLSIQSEPALSLAFFTISPDLKQTITVEMPAGETLKGLQADVHSGSVNLQDASIQNTNITATSGNAEISNLQSTRLVAKLTSGSFTASQVTADMELHITSGDAKIYDYSGNGQVSLTSGITNITQRTTANLKVDSVSGDVRIKQAPDFKGIYNVRSDSGSIDTPESVPGSVNVIKVKTTSGDILISK
ncbi:DUF4097 family beta strand repeat-containing protein [Paenibacillus terrae]|uniref:Protein liaG n=1 Tax=Paenibacillus terrae TaxID=159743 RepID=A0A0D7X8U8_9BACL|nr:DUF4097 family beta strand repeat-containing protein [Paenibacillus terrae]KJD47574.1 protein liaG [Paenibacillus terrae]